MSSTTITSMTTEALAAHSMRMFEVLFWDVTKSNEWSLYDRDGHEVDTVALTKAMLNGMANGPSEKLDCADVEKACRKPRWRTGKEPVPEPRSATSISGRTANRPGSSSCCSGSCCWADHQGRSKKIKKMEFKGIKIELPYLPISLTIRPVKVSKSVVGCCHHASPMWRRVASASHVKNSMMRARRMAHSPTGSGSYWRIRQQEEWKEGNFLRHLPAKNVISPSMSSTPISQVKLEHSSKFQMCRHTYPSTRRPRRQNG